MGQHNTQFFWKNASTKTTKTESKRLPQTHQVSLVRVARLQSEFCPKYFLLATNFLAKNAPIFSPNCLSLYFVGQKKSRQIPAKFAAELPSPKSKKNHRRASAGGQGETLVIKMISWGDLIFWSLHSYNYILQSLAELIPQGCNTCCGKHPDYNHIYYLQLGEYFSLTVGAFLLTVKLLCLQSLKALIREKFPL